MKFTDKDCVCSIPMCTMPVKYICHTQFAGSHPFCETHGPMEKGFATRDSLSNPEVWEEKT